MRDVVSVVAQCVWPAAPCSPCGRSRRGPPRSESSGRSVFGRLGRGASLPQRRRPGNRIVRTSGAEARATHVSVSRLVIRTTPGSISPREPVAGLLVHPLVAGAAGAGEQGVRRGVRRRGRLDPGEQRPAEARPCRSGATISRPMSHASPSQAGPDRADQPAGRRARRARCPRASQARRSSSVSCSAGITTPGLSCCSCTQQARWRVNSSPASAGSTGRTSTSSSRRRRGARRSGRRSAVRRTACSCRHAAIAAWSPDSSTGGTSRPRQVAGLV